MRKVKKITTFAADVKENFNFLFCDLKKVLFSLKEHTKNT